jgi:sugar/nucleoside kinase (ribokinase family)
MEASLDAMQLFPQALTILDAGSLRTGTRELAGRVDFVVCSEKFAREFSGVPDLNTAEQQATALGALHRCNGHPVVVTCGERGVLHGTGERVDRLPALPVEIRDTTAAGDIFHGAFAYGVLKGLPWLDTLRLATVAASLSVAERGGRTSIPSLAKVQEALRHAG